jgi:hypothetical protein
VDLPGEDNKGIENERFVYRKVFLSLYLMVPDYPYKPFTDKRGGYFLLMEVLAMDKHA